MAVNQRSEELSVEECEAEPRGWFLTEISSDSLWFTSRGAHKTTQFTRTVARSAVSCCLGLSPAQISGLLGSFCGRWNVMTTSLVKGGDQGVWWDVQPSVFVFWLKIPLSQRSTRLSVKHDGLHMAYDFLTFGFSCWFYDACFKVAGCARLSLRDEIFFKVETAECNRSELILSEHFCHRRARS